MVLVIKNRENRDLFLFLKDLLACWKLRKVASQLLWKYIEIVILDTEYWLWCERERGQGQKFGLFSHIYFMLDFVSF